MVNALFTKPMMVKRVINSLHRFYSTVENYTIAQNERYLA